MDLDFKPIADDRDYEDAVRVRNAYYRFDPISVEEARDQDGAMPPNKRWLRFLARDRAGRAVGRGTVRQDAWADDDVCGIELIFLAGELSEERWHGCMRDLERQAQEFGAQRLTMAVSDEHPEAVRYNEDRGFAIVQRQPMSSLDVAAFDPSPFADSARSLEDEGIEILTLERYQESHPESWERDYWRLLMDLLQDVPMPTPMREVPFDDFQRHLRLPTFTLDTRFLARDGDRLVAMSEFEVVQLDPTQAVTGLTGVRREYRRRRLASALKVIAIAEAGRRGVRILWTDNEESNPMFQLNLQLGFRKAWEWVIMKRECAADGRSNEAAKLEPAGGAA
jgi:GNAT superfamily N-acetyltransferase